MSMLHSDNPALANRRKRPKSGSSGCRARPSLDRPKRPLAFWARQVRYALKTRHWLDFKLSDRFQEGELTLSTYNGLPLLPCWPSALWWRTQSTRCNAFRYCFQFHASWLRVVWFKNRWTVVGKLYKFRLSLLLLL